MLKTIITEEAKQDLLKIGEYTEYQWGRNQRKRYIKSLVDRIDWLSENPKNGKDRSDIRRAIFPTTKGSTIYFISSTREQ